MIQLHPAASNSSPKDETSERATPKSSWRRVVRYAVSITLGLGLLSYLVWRASPEKIVTAIGSARPGPLVLGLTVGLLATYWRSRRYAVFFPVRGRRLELFAVFSILRVLSFAMPFRSGEVAALWVLKRRRFAPSVTEALPAWLLVRVFDALVLTLLFAGLVILFLHHSELSYLIGPMALVSLLAIGGMVLVARHLGQPTSTEKAGWMQNRLNALRHGFVRLRSPRSILMAILWSLMLWTGQVLLTTFMLMAVQAPLGFPELVAIAILFYVSALLPVHAPLAIGTGDSVLAVLMVMQGVEQESAIVCAVCARTLILSMVFLDAAIGGSLLKFWYPNVEPVGDETSSGESSSELGYTRQEAA